MLPDHRGCATVKRHLQDEPGQERADYMTRILPGYHLST